MNFLWRSIAIMFLASLAIGCGGGSGTTTELTPEQQDPNAAAEEAKRLMGAGGMTPGPIKQGPAGKK